MGDSVGQKNAEPPVAGHSELQTSSEQSIKISVSSNVSQPELEKTQAVTPASFRASEAQLTLARPQLFVK